MNIRPSPDPARGYEWWTIGSGHHQTAGYWLKLCLVTLCAYRWYDGRLRVEVNVMNRWAVQVPRLT